MSRGSIAVTLEGTADGFKRLLNLYEAGGLTQVAGFHIQQIGVTTARVELLLKEAVGGASAMETSQYVRVNGREIAQRRRDKGLRREDLAEESGLAKRTIDRMEGSQNVPARRNNVHRVARALGCRYQDLVIDVPAFPSHGSGTFVGREPERLGLSRFWERALFGNGGALFVTGERGIGKTELLRRFVGSLPEGEMLHAWVPCTGDESYNEFHRMLRHLSARYPDAYSKVCQQYPDTFWTRARPTPPGPARGDDSTGKIQSGMVELVTGLARNKPLLLVFEDLHRANLKTVELIGTLSRCVHTLPVLLVCECLPREASDELRHVIRRHLSTSQLETIALRPFERDEVQLFVETDLGPGFQAPPWFIDDLLYWSGGLPFYVRLRIDGLMMADALRPTERGWDLRWSRHQIRAFMPDDQTQAANDILEGLQEPERCMLETASIEGKYFHPRVVAVALNKALSAAGGLNAPRVTTDQVEATMDKLQHGHGFVRRVEDRVSSYPITIRHYTFSNGIFRDAVRNQITAGRKRSLSRSVAEALVEVFAGQCNMMADQVARLFGDGDQSGEAASYYLVAAENAARSFDDAGGIEYARRALSHLAHAPDTTNGPSIELRLQILLGVLYSATQGFSAKAVRDAYSQALAILDPIRDREQLFPSLWGLWVHHLVRADMGTAARRANEMLQQALGSDNPEELAEAYAALGLTSLFAGQLGESSGALLHGLAEYARITRDPRDLMLRLDPKVTCLCMLERLSYFTGHPREAVRRGQEAIDHAVRLKQPYSIAFANMFVSYIHYFRGDMSSAIRVGSEAVELAQSQALEQVLAWAAVTVHRARGDEAQCRAASIADLRSVLGKLEEADAKVCCPQFIAMLSELLALDHQIDCARDEIERAISMAERTGNCDYLAELLRLQGHLIAAADGGRRKRHDAAREILDRASRLSSKQGAVAQTLRILASRVALDAGTPSENESREELANAFAMVDATQASGEIVLSEAILSTSPGADSVAACAGWWHRLLRRY